MGSLINSSRARQPFGAAAWHRTAAWLVENGDSEAAIAELRRMLRDHPEDAAAHSQLLLLLHYRAEDPAQLYQEHVVWARRHAGEPEAGGIGNIGSPIRIGYVSPHFREWNPILAFIEPVLRRHDRRRFHVTCYSDTGRPDAGTDRARSLSDAWRDIAGETDAAVAGLIRADRIDILVDLAGHLAGNRLLTFARKPAPVQITWIGYPDTTGLTAVDYRLTDAIADPPGLTDGYHSEQLVRMNSGFLCYQPSSASPPVAALPLWFAGHVTFGCFQYPAKITPEVIRCWAAILERTPLSRLLLHHSFSDYDMPESRGRARISAGFARYGIEPGRLEFAGALSERQHLELYGRIDAVLDTFPYNGTTSICEALWMGVPVVALEGAFHVSRVGKSILSRTGLESLAAATQEDYIETAVTLAHDADRLAALRQSMRERLYDTPLLSPAGFTRELETRYLELVEHRADGTALFG